MLKTNLLKFAMLFMGVLVFSTSCSKDDHDEPKDDPTPTPVELEVKTISDKNVTDFEKWYYFSFATGKFVGEGSVFVADGDDAAWKERTDWDIAFHHKNVKTNSGLSGNGQGGAVALSTEDFESVSEYTGSYTADIAGEIIYRMFPMPPKYTSSTVNKELNAYAKFDHLNKIWSMTKKNVFIIKTADGKFAKFQFLNFLNDLDESGFLTFKYVYQADGSESFE